MRKLSELWKMILAELPNRERTFFICNCMNDLWRDSKISKVELERLAEDLYRQPKSAYGKPITLEMRATKNGALWYYLDLTSRVDFINDRIKEAELEETAKVESYM